MNIINHWVLNKHSLSLIRNFNVKNSVQWLRCADKYLEISQTNIAQMLNCQMRMKFKESLGKAFPTLLCHLKSFPFRGWAVLKPFARELSEFNCASVSNRRKINNPSKSHFDASIMSFTLKRYRSSLPTLNSSFYMIWGNSQKTASWDASLSAVRFSDSVLMRVILVIIKMKLSISWSTPLLSSPLGGSKRRKEK